MAIDPYTYQNIIILANEEIPAVHSDSETIFTLLLLRNIQDDSDEGRSTNLITEVHGLSGILPN